MPHLKSPYFAAVDLGSNSFHLLVMRYNQGTMEVVDREKDMVQLARGLTSRGNLSQAVQKRALVCLTRFAERLRNIPSEQIRVVGTKTLRAANNAEIFIKVAEKILGHKIEIISGYEEARLVYQGLARCVSNDNNQRLVIDIGGGSTECIVGRDFSPKLMESLNIGCISASKIMGSSITRKSMQNAYLAARAELEQIRPAYLAEGWNIVYGTSGTMKAIADVLEADTGDAVIRRDALFSLAERIIRQGGIAHKNLPKLRREVLPAGVAILQAIFDELSIDKIHVADATLKEGLIYDLLGRLDNQDTRILSVQKLQKQYNVDIAQAERVTRSALAFWQTIQSPPIPALSRTKILTWAAMLHEVGLAISHSAHHQHGYYVLRNSDIAGFGRYEQYILADLVRAQRKKMLADRFENLEPATVQALIPLLVCLRLAILLHRRREDLDCQPQLIKRGKRYKVVFPNGWLQHHPLTVSGLALEAEHFSEAGLHLGFQ
jgi:exopolyphosphatase / guanosine-5'-triphosphate,3'-diphosphate pyrophosphatase